MIDLVLDGGFKDGLPSGCLLAIMHIGLDLGRFLLLLFVGIGGSVLGITHLLVSPLDGDIENFNLVLLQEEVPCLLQIRTKAGPAVLGHQVECGIHFAVHE